MPTSSSAAAMKTRSPAGSKPSRASEAIATALAATWFFMSSAPRPQTWSSTRSPDHGSRCHSSASATTVSVCERKQRLGPSPPAQPRDEVRALGRARVELDLDAVRREVLAQQLRGERLVAGRVDGVQPQQPLQQVDRLVAERDVDRHQRRRPEHDHVGTAGAPDTAPRPPRAPPAAPERRCSSSFSTTDRSGAKFCMSSSHVGGPWA